MTVLDLSFASGESSLLVRRFSVREAISAPFTISVWACSENPALDLKGIVGQQASLHVVTGYHFALVNARRWSGVCSYIEQAQPEPTGLSTYHLRIVPALWLLGQRRNHRIFQHISIPDIVAKILDEWKIEHRFEIDNSAYPKLEYKVQYGESDFAFVSRMLEEAGIAFTMEGGEGGSTLVLGDAIHGRARRRAGLRYVDQPNQASEKEYISRVELSHDVRPGRHVHRDYDFRAPSFALLAQASGGNEGRLEQFHYEPGGFLVETGKGGDTPVADDKGTARRDMRAGRLGAERALAGDRMGRERVSFVTNAIDVEPGSVFRLEGHPHLELDGKEMLVAELSIDGSPNGEWTIAGNAVFAAVPFRPPVRTPKPRMKSLQSATVVGPAGQEIHTDEFGRVRVQFPWDREGKNDDGSSCWVRVSQHWSGLVYGEVLTPRVGQEVLVEFVQGNPDQPMITGRLYNATQPVPYRLPEHKTRSTWKSDSSLGSGGFNEIMYEDLAGKELIWEQAQKDRQKLVKNDERQTVGNDRQKTIKNDEREETSGNRKRLVEQENDIVIKAVKREKLRSHNHVRMLQDHHERIDGKDSLILNYDRHEHVGENDAMAAGTDIHLAAHVDAVFEAPDITIKGPGGFIRIDGSGVTIVGNLVRVNDSGSGGDLPLARPDTPEEPLDPKGKTWVEIVLHDEYEPHAPIAGARYVITLPDGSTKEGKLDDQGRAIVEGVEPGAFKVTFPDMDAREWRQG